MKQIKTFLGVAWFVLAICLASNQSDKIWLNFIGVVMMVCVTLFLPNATNNERASDDVPSDEGRI